jgi:hypothetical protein
MTGLICKFRTTFSVLLSLIVYLLFPIVVYADTVVATDYSGGSGNDGDPYQIASLSELRLLSESSEDWSKHFILTTDIDASDTSTWNSGEGFSPIGNDTTNFTGSFNGNGHTISGIVIDRPSQSYIGLFGYLGSGAIVKNIGLVGGSITGDQRVGGLVGLSNTGQVADCFSTTTITGKDYVGGLVGQNFNATVTKSYSKSSVTLTKSSASAGGLVGLIYNGQITKSFASGEISTYQSSVFIGGLVGQATGTTAEISNSYASAKMTNLGPAGVSSFSSIGGLVGYAQYTTFNNNFSSTNLSDFAIEGNFYGGLLGQSWEENDLTTNTFTSNYWDAEASGVSAGVNSDSETSETGITKLTTNQMTQQSSFVAFTFNNDNWKIVENITRPYLAWQEIPAAVFYSGGSGTENDPYQIASLSELRRLSETSTDWSMHFILTADIDASATSTWNNGLGFSPIGNSTTQFTGSFNGDGHVITGLTINRPTQDQVGLFGFTDSVSSIENLGMEGGSIVGKRYVGGLVGYNDGTSINFSYTTGSVSGTNEVGGLLGYNQSTLTSSYATGSVSGTNEVGGLVGFQLGTLTSSYATGSVFGGSNVGGLVGVLFGDSGTVNSSYATGSVSGETQVGGLVGELYEGSITSSYAAGSVSGESYVGGLVGRTENGLGPAVSPSYWDTETSNQLAGIGFGSGNDDATGLTSDQMTQQASFEGFDFVNDWRIAEGASYPYLAWQEMPAAFQYSGGSGTENDPYQIASLSELRRLSETSGGWDKHFILAADIDASVTSTWNNGLGFSPIGNSTIQFAGSFNGDGYVISGLTINRSSQNQVGLFGYAGSASSIKNLGIEGGTIQGMNGVGSLVGYSAGTLSSSYATASVFGDENIGGLVGTNSGTLISSYATASVTGSGPNIGGLVGYHFRGTLTSSYATGSVSGDSYVGGLVGTIASGTVTSSYWDTETSNQPTSGIGSGSGGVTGLSSAQMKQQASFEGFDFQNTWQIFEGLTIPYLSWQSLSSVAPPGTPIIASTDIGNGEITFTLGSTSTNGGSQIVSYQASCSDGSNSYISSSSTNVIVIDGLAGGVAYRCTVIATNEIGLTGFSSIQTEELIPLRKSNVILKILPIILEQ